MKQFFAVIWVIFVFVGAAFGAVEWEYPSFIRCKSKHFLSKYKIPDTLFLNHRKYTYLCILSQTIINKTIRILYERKNRLFCGV